MTQVAPIFREIPWPSEAMDQAVQLRLELLRAPLGLSFSKSELAKERNFHHAGGFLRESVVAYAQLVPKAPGILQMRQVAVRECDQGKGWGRDLVHFIEKMAAKNGASKMVLHAREPVIGFYEKLGYETEGKTFFELEIPHMRMVKVLSE